MRFTILLLFLCLPAFGVGTFSYTESTNTIEVTDGTSGAPATFKDMYTADQAGTATDLLLAEAGTSAPGNSLTYAIRPTHDKAIIIKCIVAAKTAEADFIFITGTDAWGAAQTESLDVTAGNGTYTTTKRFATATDFDCSDNAAGGGVQWADGTIQVTQDIWGVVWEFVADAQYKIDADIEFGDSSTSTYFTTKNEQVYFETNSEFSVTSVATLQMGLLEGDWGKQGSTLNVFFPSSGDIIEITEGTASFLMYDSRLFDRNSAGHLGPDFNAGTLVDMRNCQIAGISSGCGPRWNSTISTLIFNRVYFPDVSTIQPFKSPDTISKVHMHSAKNGISASAHIVAFDMLITSIGTLDYRTTSEVTLEIRNPIEGVSTPQCSHANSMIFEEYTCNIHVTDKEGNDLSGVLVTIKDVDGEIISGTDSTANINEGVSIGETAINVTDGTQFSADDVILFDCEFCLVTNVAANVLTLTRGYYTNYDDARHATGGDIYIVGSVATDASGDIEEQVIRYKKWRGVAETLTDYSPHEFTFTKAGFEPYICKNVTVSMPIVWKVKVGGAKGAWEVKYR